MTLGAQLSAGATSITLNTGAWPTVSSPNTLTLVIEPDTANEEIVYVTAHTANSTSATILRAQESTTDITHASGSVVKHMITGADLQEAHRHMEATNYSTNGNVALHGIGTGEGAVVGTDKSQTLTKKRISILSPDNNEIIGLTVANVSGIAGTYAPLASPNFTGTPQISGVNIATTATAPASHTHGNLTNDGKIGTSSGNVIVTGASGVLTALAAGSAGQFLSYNGTWATPSGATAGVSSLAGTANQISASASTGAVTLSFPTGGVTVPTGSLVATTPTTGDNTTKIATTAFVQTAVAGVSGGTAIARYVRSADTATIQGTATSAFAASNSLTANTLYKFSYLLFVNFTYSSTTASINLTHTFTQTPQEITWVFNNANDLLTGHNTVTSAVSVSNTMSSSVGRYIEVEGYFKTNATTGGTFNPQINLTFNGSPTGNIVVKKGSSIELFSISAAGSWI